MTQDASPFDHRPDEQLGEALRAALQPGDQRRFVARVLDAAERVFGEVASPTWAYALAEWARPGLVAAMLVMAAVGFWVGTRAGASGGNGEMTAVLDDPLAAGAEQATVPILMAGYEAPSVGDVLGATLLGTVAQGSVPARNEPR